MLEDFEVGTFSGYIGDGFRVYPDDSSPLKVELISVTGPDEGLGRPYSIVFRGQKNTLLPQRIYRMEHAVR